MPSKIQKRNKLLIIITTFCVMFTFLQVHLQAETKLNVVYLSMWGNDNYEGKSYDTAVQTFEKAKSLLAKDGIIKIFATYQINDKQTWSLPKAEFGEAKVIRSEYDEDKMIEVSATGELTLQDIVLDGGATWNGAVNNGKSATEPIIKSSGKLTLQEGSYIQNNDNIGTLAGGILVEKGSLDIVGGTVQNNKSIYEGGGITLYDEWDGTVPTATMQDGNISNNIASSGGGIALIKASFTMQGGVISSNTSTTAGYSTGGGGVTVGENSAMNMTGGQIIKNISSGTNSGTGVGAGVNLPYSNSVLTVSNSATITDNTRNGKRNNVAMDGGTKIYVNGAFTGKIGVSLYDEPREVAPGYIVPGDYPADFKSKVNMMEGKGYSLKDTDIQNFSVDLDGYLMRSNGDAGSIVKAITASFSRNYYSPKPLPLIPSQLLAYGEKVAVPEETTRFGYRLVGWENNDILWDFDKDVVTKNVQLSASWKANQYTVAFDGNGATSGTMNQQLIAYEGSVKIDKAAYQREYEVKMHINENAIETTTIAYDFVGWGARKNSMFPTYLDQDVLDKPTVSGDVNDVLTLYALWSPTKSMTLPTPSRDGYQFTGWYQDAQLTDKIMDATIPVETDKELYAGWSDIEAPEIQVGKIPTTWQDSGKIELQITDNEKVDTLQVSKDGGEYQIIDEYTGQKEYIYTDILIGEHTYQFKAIDTSGNSQETDKIIIKQKNKEIMPTATIDFRNQKLSKLIPNQKYIVNETTLLADTDGLIDLKEEWLQSSLTISRVATKESTANSDNQILEIPARPEAPAVYKYKKNILATDATMEYRIGTGKWQAITTTKLDNLEPGYYEVRYQATDTNFASKVKSIMITNTPGKSSIEVDKSDIKNIQVDESSLRLAVLTKEDKKLMEDGSNIRIVIKVNQLDNVNEEQKEMLIKSLDTADAAGTFLNISVFKIIDEEKPQEITNVQQEIEITFEVPESLKKQNRVYYVYRLHNQQITRLNDLDNNLDTVTIKTGKFSTYLLAYNDAIAPSIDTDDTNTDVSINVSEDTTTIDKNKNTSSNMQNVSTVDTYEAEEYWILMLLMSGTLLLLKRK